MLDYQSIKNPFVTSGYAGAEYFCDRVNETATLTRLLTNQNNVALISTRRLGKTDLLRHCFAQPEIRDRYYTFEVDIYATSSLHDFVNVFGKAVLDALRPLGKKTWEGFLHVLASLRAEISFDINGQPSWGIGLGNVANPITTLDEIFTYLQNADRPCLVSIDEFQQILRYPDGDKVEAALRTYIQRCSNANFVFSGSQRHLMGAMFTSPNRPFYQSVTIINLKAIPLDKYTEFCCQKFKDAGKTVDTEVIEAIYNRFNHTTMYMQKVMNELFSQTPRGSHCSINMLDDAITSLLNLSSDTYTTILSQMPEKQRNLFVAIAAEGRAHQISGGQFVRKYRLLSPSSVLSAAKGLLEKDFITQDSNGAYMVYDLFLAEWLRQR